MVPVISALAQRDAPTQISVDTSKAAVAHAAVAAGATLINDVSALRADPEMVDVVAESGLDCCLMHMLGEPRTMQQGVGGSSYGDVVDDVKAFLEGRLAFAVDAGIKAEERILLDPGIGFGKTFEHNFAASAPLGGDRRAGTPSPDRHVPARAFSEAPRPSAFPARSPRM